MKIKKITIKNFYSFKNVTLNLEKYKGLTLIKGLNKDAEGSNGAGKSALIEAVYFGLTGKTIRKSTEAAMVNNQAKKGCLVELTLDDNVVIKRYKKPSKLELFIGKENKSGESIAATQKHIDVLLNTNSKVLMTSMFFGQSNDLTFLDASPEDKRTIIRNFLNLDDIFKMRDNIKSHKSEFYQTAKAKSAVIEEHVGTIRSLERKLKDIEGREFPSLYNVDISLSSVLKMEEKVRDYTAERGAIISLLNKEVAHNNALKDPNTKCRTCGQPTPETILQKNKNKALESDSSIAQIQTDLANLLEPAPPPFSSIDFSFYLDWKNSQSEKETYKSLLGEIKEKISDADEIRTDNEKMYEVMRFWEKAFSEQGVIKYIIKNILTYFNKQCNYYLGYLTNSKFFVEFDEELNEKIVSLKLLVPYISLSGGEKRKINLAVLLALKDLLILTDRNQSDLLFFDEIAENLDEQGIIGLHQLLQELKKSKNIFVVTHNKYLKTLLDSSKRILIIKENGISTVKG